MKKKLCWELLKYCALGAGVGVAACARQAHKIAFPKIFTIDQVRKYESDHGTRGNYDQIPRTRYTVAGKDGYTLNCEYVEANPGSRKIVICTHGYTSNRESDSKYAIVYAKLGFNCIVYDCRGHGENEKAPCSIGNLEAQDLLHVIDDAYERYGKDIQLGLQGESMGSATSLIVLQYKPKVRFVVADCGFASLYDLMGELFKQRHVGFMLRPVNCLMKWMYGFNLKETCPRESLRGNHVPICFIHGTADSFIKPQNSDELAQATDGYNEIHKVNGAEHALSRMVLGEEGYLKIVKPFLEYIGEK